MKKESPKKNLYIWGITIVLIVFALGFSVFNSSDKTQSVKEKTNSITKQLRCLECEGLSVYDSDTTLSVAIKRQVEEKVKDGQNKEEIISSFEDTYGEFIRLNPSSKDGNWAVFVFPVLAFIALLGAIFIYTRKTNSFKIGKYLLNSKIFYWSIVVLVISASGIIYKVDVSNKQEKNIEAKQSTTQTPEETRKSLEDALKSSPSAENYRALGIFQFAQEEYFDALKNLDQAVKLNPQDASSAAYASYIVFRAQQYESAKSRSKSAVEIEPNNIAALFFRGLILRESPTLSDQEKADNLAESNANFDKVIQLDPGSEFASQINEIRS